eukprot:6574053-Pyramimonas_sp.AAC.1
MLFPKYSGNIAKLSSYCGNGLNYNHGSLGGPRGPCWARRPRLVCSTGKPAANAAYLGGTRHPHNRASWGREM